MPKISEMEADPDFVLLTPNEQEQVRLGFLRKHLLPDPEFLSLNPEEKQKVSTRVMGGKPLPSGFDLFMESVQETPRSLPGSLVARLRQQVMAAPPETRTAEDIAREAGVVSPESLVPPSPEGTPLTQVERQAELGRQRVEETTGLRPRRLPPVTPPLAVPPEAEGAPERPPAEVERELRRAGSVVVPPRSLTQEITETRPAQAITVGATETPEYALLRILNPSGNWAEARQQVAEDLGSNPTKLDRVIQMGTSLMSPATLASFLLSTVTVPAKAVQAGLTRMLGTKVATEAMAAVVQRGVAGATSFTGYETLKRGTEQTARALETGQPPSATEFFGGVATGAATGAVLGPTSLLPSGIVQKAAEAGVLATVPAVIEGRLPTLRDLTDAGLLVGALALTHALPQATAKAIAKPATQRTSVERMRVNSITPEQWAEIGAAIQTAGGVSRAVPEVRPLSEKLARGAPPDPEFVAEAVPPAVVPTPPSPAISLRGRMRPSVESVSSPEVIPPGEAYQLERLRVDAQALASQYEQEGYGPAEAYPLVRVEESLKEIPDRELKDIVLREFYEAEKASAIRYNHPLAEWAQELEDRAGGPLIQTPTRLEPVPKPSETPPSKAQRERPPRFTIRDQIRERPTVSEVSPEPERVMAAPPLSATIQRTPTETPSTEVPGGMAQGLGEIPAVSPAPVALKAETREPARVPESEKVFGMPERTQTVQPDPSRPDFRPARNFRERDEVVRRREIVRMLEDATRPIRKGTVGPTGRQAAGQFKVREEVIRLKRLPDVETASHEVGHLIQKYALPQMDLTPEMRSGLEDLGRRLYGRRIPAAGYLGEGLAEFTRLYVEDPAQMAAAVPGFLDVFERSLTGRMPEVLEALRTARSSLQMWRDQPDLAKVASRISPSDGTAPGMTLKDRWRRFYANWFDRDTAIQDVERVVTQGRPIPADQSAYIAARAFRRVDATAQSFLTDGPVEYGSGGRRTGPGIFRILAPVNEHMDRFEPYIYARRLQDVFRRAEEAQAAIARLRALERTEGTAEGEREIIRESIGQFEEAIAIAKKERASGVTPDHVNRAIADAEGRFPAFAVAARQLDAYQEAVQRYRRDAGLMSDRVYRAITEAWPRFVPFVRDIESPRWPTVSATRRLGDVPQRLKRYTGSAENILSPIASIFARTDQAVRDVARNEAVSRFYEMARQAEGMGRLIEEVPAPEKDTVKAWIGGEVKHLRMHPDLYETLSGHAETPHSWLLAFWRPLTQMLKYGTTIRPIFIARNIVRDQFDAFVQTTEKYRPTDTASALAEILRRGPEYQRYQVSGGAQAGLQATLNRENVQRAMDRLRREESARGQAFIMLRHPLDSLALLGSLAEESTRLGQFRRVYEAELSRGATPQAAMEKAGMASAELTIDFRRMGAKAAAVNQIIPFFNPSMQSMDKFFRSWKEQPTKIAMRGALISSISLLLSMANQDDPRVRDLENWRKVYFWIIPTGKMNTATWERMSAQQRAQFEKEHPIYQVPKPFVWGQTFGTVMEILFDRYVQGHPEALNRMWPAIVQGFSVPWTAAGITPFIENAVDYSFFRERPIVPGAMQRLRPSEQYTAYTPETYKQVSKLFRWAEEVPLAGQLASPLKVEHLVTGIGGAGAGEVVQLAEPLVRRLAPSPRPEIAPRIADRPIVGGIAARRPSGQSQTVADFYEALRKSEESAASFKRIRGDPLRATEATAFAKENERLLAQRGLLQDAAKQLSDIRRTQEQVRLTSTLTAEERRQWLDALEETKASLALRALRAIGKRESPPPGGAPPATSGLARLLRR